MKGDPEFARAVLALSTNEAPWDTFLVGLRKHQASCIDALLAASADELPVAQGRARAMADVLSAIEKARSVIDRTPKT